MGINKTGIELITEERKRQIEKEGWDAIHDRQHMSNELSKAAACYALDDEEVFVLKAPVGKNPVIFDPWPWFNKNHSSSIYIKVWDKRHKHDRIKKLKIAGALIAAELDRIITEEYFDSLPDLENRLKKVKEDEDKAEKIRSKKNTF